MPPYKEPKQILQYKRYHNEIADLFKITKLKHYFQENRKNSRALWSGINKIVYSKKSSKNNSSIIYLRVRKQNQTSKTLLRISITFLPALAKIFKTKIFSTKKHFSNFLKNPITSLTLFSFHQQHHQHQHQKNQVYIIKSIRELQVHKFLGVPSQQQHTSRNSLNLLKTLYQDHCLN